VVRYEWAEFVDALPGIDVRKLIGEMLLRWRGADESGSGSGSGKKKYKRVVEEHELEKILGIAR
jgi:hypothetical protein